MRQNILSFLKSHALDLAMIAGAVITIAVAGFRDFAADCEKVPQDVLRLHIIAESNSKEDQDFKLELRDFVLENFSAQLADCDSLDEAYSRSVELLPLIREKSQEFAAQKGCEAEITAEITQMYFTTRKYETTTLPAGDYTALRIVIGEGKGENWWCVMFPALCLPAVSDNSQSQPVVNLPESTTSDAPKIKFAVFEFLSGLFK